MSQRLGLTTFLVNDYDEGIAFFVTTLGFALVQDALLGAHKRWVVVRPAGGAGGGLLLARAVGEQQTAAVGRQAGGRVFLFLETDDFARDHAAYIEAGLRFVEAPRREAYGRVAVFEDPWGNRWDLIETTGPSE